MSGIAGVVHGDGRDVSPALLEQVSTASAIRADDGVAHWAGGSAGLIRFRHATTPEALRERQPSPAASGNVIAFDGRLDNREELIAMLGRDGAALRQRPDEEIALALFERIGDGFMRHLAGDYAFAIWQPDQRRLFCARAPVGRRPFFYHLSADGFAFASEPKALIVGLSLDRGVNEPLIAEYLARRVVTRGETFWRALNTLPQGSALAYQDGALRQWHWDDAPPEDLSRLSEGAHIERFNELLDQAIIACTRSNTGVVAQLSGGLDSSSILSRATELHRAGKIDRHVAAITARYPGSPVDESEWSGAVEAHLGITASVVQGSIFDPDAARAWSANTLQMPLRPNTLDTLEGNFRNLERHGERVLLSGEGGDELLNGNHAHWPDEIRRGRIDLVARQALAMPGATLPGKVRAFVSEGFVRWSAPPSIGVRRCGSRGQAQRFPIICPPIESNRPDYARGLPPVGPPRHCPASLRRTATPSSIWNRGRLRPVRSRRCPTLTGWNIATRCTISGCCASSSARRARCCLETARGGTCSAKRCAARWWKRCGRGSPRRSSTRLSSMGWSGSTPSAKSRRNGP